MNGGGNGRWELFGVDLSSSGYWQSYYASYNVSLLFHFGERERFTEACVLLLSCLACLMDIVASSTTSCSYSLRGHISVAASYVCSYYVRHNLNVDKLGRSKSVALKTL